MACSRGSAHEAADGAGTVPAGSAQGVASSDQASGAIMGDVPKTVTEIDHEETVYDDWDCRTHA